MDSNKPSGGQKPPSDSPAPHPLLDPKYSAMMGNRSSGPSRAASPPPSGPSDVMTDGLTVIAAVMLVDLVLGLMAGAMQAQTLEAVLRHHDSPMMGGAIMKLMSVGIRLAMLGTGGALIYGMALVARRSDEVRGKLHIAIGAGCLELLLSLFFLAMEYSSFFGGMDSSLSMRSTLGSISSLADVVGSVLLLESLLVLRRQSESQIGSLTDGAARAAFWGLLIGRYALAYLPFFGSAWRDVSQWIWFGARAVLRVGYAVLIVTLAREATATLSTTATDRGSGTPAGAEDHEALRSQGGRNLFFGLLWCLGGIAVTAWSFQTARSQDGRYMVAYGAIIVGAVQAIRGLLQISRAR
jgi:hypothetical protein